MKMTQLISILAAAGLVAGCSSTRNQTQNDQSTNPSNNGTPSTSMNTQGNINEPSGSQANAADTNQIQTSPEFDHAQSMRGSEVTFDQLPQAAQNAVRQQIGNQDIDKIKQETKQGQVAYKVELQKNDWYTMRPTLTVAADGSILGESHLKGITEAAGAQTPQSQSTSSMGSEANPNGTSTNSYSK